MQVGDDVVAIGNPLTLQNTVSTGIVSGKRALEGNNYLQTTAPISMGSSGGALFNMYGKIIGVTTAYFGGGQNLNLVIPVSDIKWLLAGYNDYTFDKVYNLEHVASYTNGDSYEGDFKNGKQDGSGVYKWADGDIYSGEWKGGIRTGKGIYSWANGDIYVGDFVSGKMEGYGILTAQNGFSYKGSWKNNNWDGYGEATYIDKWVYKGNWVNNLREGYGEIYDSSGVVKYKGQFLQNNIATNTNNVVVPESNNQGITYNKPETSSSTDIKYPLYIYLDEDKRVYLGKLVSSAFDSDSIFNKYGSYGNKFNSDSIWNEFGSYGSKFSSYSAFNKFALNPPLIIDSNGNIVGRLSVNEFTTGAVNTNDIKALLIKLGQ